jgi:hypothetical protein
MFLFFFLFQPIYSHPISEGGDIDYESPFFYERVLTIITFVLVGGIFAGKREKVSFPSQVLNDMS